MRARNIKPDFFLNEHLSKLKFEARLLFIGLWCYADREGFFEWRPERIKAAIFPYENCNIKKLLNVLTECNDKLLLHVIDNDGFAYGYLPGFKKHQKPHPHEKRSNIPQEVIKQCHDMSLHNVALKEDIRKEDIRKEDTRNEDTRNPDSGSSELKKSFKEFWEAFNDKRGKEPAFQKSWLTLRPSPELTKEIVAGAKRYAIEREGILKSGGKVKMAQGWLTDKRWEDEPLAKPDRYAVERAMAEKYGDKPKELTE